MIVLFARARLRAYKKSSKKHLIHPRLTRVDSRSGPTTSRITCLSWKIRLGWSHVGLRRPRGQTQLSKLLERVEEGEETVIVRHGTSGEARSGPEQPPR